MVLLSWWNLFIISCHKKILTVFAVLAFFSLGEISRKCNAAFFINVYSWSVYHYYHRVNIFICKSQANNLCAWWQHSLSLFSFVFHSIEANHLLVLYGLFLVFFIIIVILFCGLCPILRCRNSIRWWTQIIEPNI